MTDVDFTLPATSNCVSSPWSCWSATSFSTRLSTCSHHWRHLPPQRGCQHLTPPRPARGCCPPSEGDRIVTNKRFHWKKFFFSFSRRIALNEDEFSWFMWFRTKGFTCFCVICAASVTHFYPPFLCDTKIDWPVPHTQNTLNTKIQTSFYFSFFLCIMCHLSDSPFNKLQHKTSQSFNFFKQTWLKKDIFLFEGAFLCSEAKHRCVFLKVTFLPHRSNTFLHTDVFLY